ncbi:MAG: glycosyltransferase family 2 protein [Patescibacteria group bacterium]|jgi:glycosyltransferase involved in cell wall biosynthesis
MNIVCVIPAFNEEANITRVIAGVRPYVQEIVVVDDNSRDSTAVLAAAAGATVLHHHINRGQGAALQTGNDYALRHGADIIVHFDADDQFLASEIPDMIQPLVEARADIVFGSRFLGKKANFPPIKKYIINPLAQIFTRFFLGIKLSDSQNGFRALSRQAAQVIQIDNRAMAHASEIQSKAFQQKLRVVEVPVTVIYHEFGQKLSGGLQIAKDLLIHKIIK